MNFLMILLSLVEKNIESIRIKIKVEIPRKINIAEKSKKYNTPMSPKIIIITRLTILSTINTAVVFPIGNFFFRKYAKENSPIFPGRKEEEAQLKRYALNNKKLGIFVFIALRKTFMFSIPISTTVNCNNKRTAKKE